MNAWFVCVQEDNFQKAMSCFNSAGTEAQAQGGAEGRLVVKMIVSNFLYIGCTGEGKKGKKAKKTQKKGLTLRAGDLPSCFFIFAAHLLLMSC